MLCTIYRFTNLITGKQYYGSTIVDPKIRYNQHIYNATHPENPKYNYPLYCSIRKRGLDNYKFEIIEQRDCTEREIRQIEHEYIKKYNTLCPNGYNQTSNTEHPLNDPATYAKMKETKRENAKDVVEINQEGNIINHWRSIVDCAEANPDLDEKKIAAVCRGERLTTANRIFRWIDEDENIIEPEYKRDEYKGAEGTTQIQSSSRQVAKINLETKEIIEIYPTIALAARENNCDPSGISKVCRGLRNKAGNFGWKYIN